MSAILTALHFLVVFAAILIGVRTSGVGIGLWGAVGTVGLVFGFDLPMGSPPIDALLIIVAVIVTTATMQAAGGTDWMVLIAARPRSITIIAPVVSLILDTLAGTSNIVFSLLPVIEETAYRTGVRAHKPLSMCVVATSIALATSPVSAAMAAMITVVEDAEVGWSVAGILALTYPAALIGTVITAVIVSMIGRGAKGSTPTDAPRTEELLAPLRQRVTARGRTTALIYLAGGSRPLWCSR